MSPSSGYFTLLRHSGTALRVHYTLPLLALMITGFRFWPLSWVSFFALVVAHELGHALFMRRYRMRVIGIHVHGLGGVCLGMGHPTPWQRSVIAWGGVAAQAVVLAVAGPVALMLGARATRSDWLFQLFYVLIGANAAMMVLNLIPLGGLDGVEAWRIVPLYMQKRQEQRKQRRTALRRTEAEAARPPSIASDAKAARETLRALDAREDAGDLPDVRGLVKQIFENARSGDAKRKKKSMN